jgi:hypothetical protein
MSSVFHTLPPTQLFSKNDRLVNLMNNELSILRRNEHPSQFNSVAGKDIVSNSKSNAFRIHQIFSTFKWLAKRKETGQKIHRKNYCQTSSSSFSCFFNKSIKFQWVFIATHILLTGFFSLRFCWNDGSMMTLYGHSAGSGPTSGHSQNCQAFEWAQGKKRVS